MNITLRHALLFKKFSHFLALFITAGNLQAVIPTTLLFTSSALVHSQIVHAEESQPVTIVQAFGYDSNKGAYKMLVQSNSGNQYIVWYDNLIGAKVGSTITLTYEGSGSSLYFHRLLNIGNGKEARVDRYLKVNQ
jgi:hypothetical protein